MGPEALGGESELGILTDNFGILVRGGKRPSTKLNQGIIAVWARTNGPKWGLTWRRGWAIQDSDLSANSSRDLNLNDAAQSISLSLYHLWSFFVPESLITVDF